MRIRNDTPCTSLENKWLMPVQDIPYLCLKDIDFSTPKCQPIVPSSACTCIPGPSRKIEALSPSEIEEFFHFLIEDMIVEEKQKKKQLSIL